MANEFYSEGWKANANFVSKNECPYVKGSFEAKSWFAGWYGANDDPCVQSEKSAYATGEIMFYG